MMTGIFFHFPRIKFESTCTHALLLLEPQNQIVMCFCFVDVTRSAPSTATGTTGSRTANSVTAATTPLRPPSARSMTTGAGRIPVPETERFNAEVPRGFTSTRSGVEVQRLIVINSTGAGRILRST